MKIKSYKGGYDRNFFYLLESEKEVAVIDCFDSKMVLGYLAKNNAELKYVVSTHSHFDHVEANAELLKKTRAKLVMHQLNQCDLPVNEGDILILGKEKLKILHTPGHTADSICLLVNDNLFTGDTLFVGNIGGHFYAESSITQPKSLKKIIKLSDEIKIYPGHDYGKTPTSTIKKERETNRYLFPLLN